MQKKQWELWLRLRLFIGFLKMMFCLKTPLRYKLFQQSFFLFSPLSLCEAIRFVVVGLVLEVNSFKNITGLVFLSLLIKIQVDKKKVLYTETGFWEWLCFFYLFLVNVTIVQSVFLNICLFNSNFYFFPTFLFCTYVCLIEIHTFFGYIISWRIKRGSMGAFTYLNAVSNLPLCVCWISIFIIA